VSSLVGIDLGTTNSCIAVYADGRAQILRNPEGQLTTPSVVTFAEDGAVLVGAPARRQAIMNPQSTITDVKRLVGRRFNSPQIETLRGITPYAIVKADNGDAWVRVGEQTLSPPEVQSHILERLRVAAERVRGFGISEAVVTVPAYFDEPQRQATRDAATIAGIDVARILNEPTAAALAYGLARAQGKVLAVVDLGGGTYDVTIMTVEDGVFEVMATTGDMLLGGQDFDRSLALMLAEEIDREHSIDVFSDPVAAQRLISEAEETKKLLTELDKVTVGLPFLAMGANGPINVQRVVTRGEFEQLTQPLIERLIEPCRKALSYASIGTEQVDEVLLVGGMTRCPAVRTCVAGFFGRKPSMGVNPDEAVALGAALESGILSGDIDDSVLIDVVPHTIGLRVSGNRMAPLVRRSTPLPTRITKTFSTTHDDQPYVELIILQGEYSEATRNRHLSTVRLEDIPSGPSGSVRIGVTFMVDASGLLSVTARETATGNETAVRVVAESGLPRSEVARLTVERRLAAKNRP
jgi:molecular chaperone DnaK